MNNQATNEVHEMDFVEIDLLDMLRLLWQNIWSIIISVILCGSIAFSTAMFSIEPQYTSSAMMYVNNHSISQGASAYAISASQISAARSLLDLYVIILESRTTLETAIEKADLPYTCGQLRNIVSAKAVDDTEIFSISATCANPDDAKLIVDTLVEILPDRIAAVVDGSSVRVLDRASLPSTPSSPSYTRYGVVGMLLGALISCAFIIIRDMMNTTVRDEDYLRYRYNIPILAVVPDVFGSSGKSYGYKYKKGKKSGYKYGQKRHAYYGNLYETLYESNYENFQFEQNNNKDGGDK
ncbi:MAG: hypothetical protein IKB87_04475 [Clostridia bacterium]|nr:hypothetical protein [Clostridia bacterium]